MNGGGLDPPLGACLQCVRLLRGHAREGMRQLARYLKLRNIG
jgi:hypothetical protein